MDSETKELLTERAHLVRCYEAACKIEFATEADINFRVAISKKLGAAFNLRELRPMTFEGPGRPPAQPTKK